jgi:hypothetical protein
MFHQEKFEETYQVVPKKYKQYNKQKKGQKRTKE